jgi:hypothetical protein
MSLDSSSPARRDVIVTMKDGKQRTGKLDSVAKNLSGQWEAIFIPDNTIGFERLRLDAVESIRNPDGSKIPMAELGAPASQSHANRSGQSTSITPQKKGGCFTFVGMAVAGIIALIVGFLVFSGVWTRDRSDTRVGYCPPDPVEALIFLREQGLLIDTKITTQGVQAIVSPAMLDIATDPQQLDQLANVVDCVHGIDRATSLGVDIMTPGNFSVQRTYDEAALTALREKRARNGTLVQ